MRKRLTKVVFFVKPTVKIEKLNPKEIQVSLLVYLIRFSLELSSTEMFADYEEMVAQGLERQKKMNNEAND